MTKRQNPTNARAENRWSRRAPAVKSNLYETLLVAALHILTRQHLIRAEIAAILVSYRSMSWGPGRIVHVTFKKNCDQANPSSQFICYFEHMQNLAHNGIHNSELGSFIHKLTRVQHRMKCFRMNVCMATTSLASLRLIFRANVPMKSTTSTPYFWFIPRACGAFKVVEQLQTRTQRYDIKSMVMY